MSGVKELLRIDVPVMRLILGQAVPTTLSMCLYFVSTFFTLYFAGLYNDPSLLAAYGLAQVFIMSLLFNTNQGMTGALRTLSSQEFGKKIPDAEKQANLQGIYKTAVII
jgi:Na+-driven multidrug efflux pump